MSIAAITKRRHFDEQHQPLAVGFFHLVWIFLLCSLLGLVGETLASYVIDGRWESRAGYVLGPLSPLYGLGAVLMTIAVNPLRSHGAGVKFLAAGVTGAALEYVAGWFFEARYGIVAWSYAGQPFNLHGHTSLLMAGVWGLIGLIWIDLALPHAMRLVERIPLNVRKSLTIAAFCFIAADSALTLVCLDSWFWRVAGYPPSNPVQQFCAMYFGDEFMGSRFETMGMWVTLATRL